MPGVMAAALSSTKVKPRAAPRRAGTDMPLARVSQLYGPGLPELSTAYLEALPIPTALIVCTDTPVSVRTIASNHRFRSLSADPAERRQVDRGAHRFMSDPELLTRIQSFMNDAAAEEVEFDWRDHDPVAERVFTVRLSQLTGAARASGICALFLIERTAEIRTEVNLRREMLSDALTGLPNRAGFEELLEALIESGRDSDARCAVMVVDLVRFSRVNECIGSMAGDELLITVARRLMSALRAGDRLARTGGDEFGILLSRVDGPGDVLHVAKRVQSVLNAPCKLSDLEIRVDCAIGCAIKPVNDADCDRLSREARFALKRAKDSGRLEIHQSNAFTAARHRFTLETELRRALEQDRLSLAFQPIIDLSTGRCSGFEALARWTDENRGEVSPTEFIPVAEESGLIVPLGRWALRKASETLAGWDNRAGRILPVRMSVNLSAIQIARDDVAAAVSEALRSANVDGDRLTLELTESVIVADPDRAARVLNALKNLDTTLAMDDFGTGYSNLASLQALPIDMLKIDRSFVSGMLGSKDKIAIVRAVLSLADALNMATTAEGIESNELAQTLAALGCQFGQGYHYATSMTPDAAYDFLSRPVT